MFKNEIIEKAKEDLRNLKKDDFKIVINDDGLLTLISETNEFRFYYNGNKVMFKWLVGKAFYENIKPTNTLREYYYIVKNAYENGLDLERQLQITL